MTDADPLGFWAEVRLQASLLNWTPPPLVGSWGPVEVSVTVLEDERLVFIHGDCRREDGAFIHVGINSLFAQALYEYQPGGSNPNPLYLALTLWDALSEVHSNVADSQGRFGRPPMAPPFTKVSP